MIKVLKSARKAAISDAADMKVRSTVESIIAAVRDRGDVAVLEFSGKVDQWTPASFRLSKAQLDELVRSAATMHPFVSEERR